jgi:hypothetical protein
MGVGFLDNTCAKNCTQKAKTVLQAAKTAEITTNYYL